MEKVTVRLTMPWPTAAGLRRPFEGPLEVSYEEAERIVAAGGGEIVEDESKNPKKPTAAQKKSAAEKAAADSAKA